MTSLAHVTAPTSGAVTTHIRAQLPDLTPSGRRIAETVLDNPHGIVHLTVTDLADHTNTSVATVVRFCQDIGLRGFQDLKIRLASEPAPPTHGIYDDVAGDDAVRYRDTRALALGLGETRAARREAQEHGRENEPGDFRHRSPFRQWSHRRIVTLLRD